jgi:hypothetical protein
LWKSWEIEKVLMGNRMKSIPIVAATLMTQQILQGPTYAQWRDDQQPVVAPAIVRPSSIPDVIAPFKSQYQAAGEPRILLFWNVSFDDATETNRENVDTTRRTSTDSATGLDKQTNGPAGNATLHESDDKKSETIERVTGSRLVDPAKQPNGLTSRNAVELETAFREHLQSAGVRLMNRSASIRLTQADKDRERVDPKLIEADAVLAKADLLLEVVMVPDQSTPLGAGFKITMTDIKSGAEVFSIYTAARPEIPQLPSRYVVTDSGFEKRQPHIQVTASDVGVALARAVMRSAGPRLSRNHIE